VLALSLPGRLLSEVAPLLAAMRTVNVSPPTCAAARRCPRLPPRWPRRDREVREGPVDVDYANCTNGP
jgi:hypothetical protein